MSGKGNRGFADMIAGEGGRPPAPRLPPRTGILESRENRLAELAAGQAVTRVQELVDPARCRMWPGHNRDYAMLTEISCADLIESLRAQGRQEVPAIVRRLRNDKAHDYEVICGARRHFSVSFLRANDRPDFRFLIEPRELSDEEAFRVADLENRSRKDLSDYERACDYARAVDLYYDGSQQRMAERLQVSKSWLSRYLELAKLPPEILACFARPHDIGISHAARLAPLLRAPFTRKLVEATAVGLAQEQAARREAGQNPIPPAAVVARLADPPKPARKSQRIVEKDADGRVMVRADRHKSGGIMLDIPAVALEHHDVLLQVIDRALRRFT